MAEFVYNDEQYVKVGDVINIILPVPCNICGKRPITRHKDGYGWEVKCDKHNETNWYQTRDAATQSWNEMMMDE